MLNIFRKIQKNKRIFKAIIFVIIIAVFFVNVKFVMAADTSFGSDAGKVAGTAGLFVLGGVGAAVATVLSIIAYVLTAVIGLLITVVVALVIQVAQYGNIINVPTVIQGWVIIRDLCNMSFILILLIIAFATILRQENFSAKKILPKLLIMAVLINFSRTIFGLLVDFSQVIMLTFVNAFAAGGGWFIKAFRTDLLLAFRTAGDGAGGLAVSSWSTALAIIAGVLASIITLIVMSVILAVLVSRIVMLWIYTIFSPLVFLGFAFPPLQKYTGKIWEDFTKQLVVGPVLAFFIWLALTTAETSSSSLMGSQTMTASTEVCAGIGAFFCQGNLQQFIIVIGLLMGGLMVAQSMGGAAGSIAGKGLDWAKKSLAAPVKMGKAGLDRIGDKIHKETHFDPNLVRVWQGWNEKRKENAVERYRDNVVAAKSAADKGGRWAGAMALTGAPGDAWNQIASYKGWKQLIWDGGGKWLRKKRDKIQGGAGYEEQKKAISNDVEAEEETRRKMWTSTEKADSIRELGVERKDLASVQGVKTKIQKELASLEARLARNPKDQKIKDETEAKRVELGQWSDEEVKVKGKIDARFGDIAEKQVVSKADIKKQDEKIEKRKQDLANIKPDEDTVMGKEAKRKTMWTAKEATDNDKMILDDKARLLRHQIDRKDLEDDIAKDDIAIADIKAGGTSKRVFTEEKRNSAEEKIVKMKGTEEALKQNIEEREKNRLTKRVTSEEEIGKLNNEIREKKDQAAKYIPMYGFESRTLEEKGISDKAAKIKNIDDAAELVRMMKDAIKDKDKFMIKAIARSLTQNYNDNEFLEELAHDSGYTGLQNLMNALAGEKVKLPGEKEASYHKNLDAGFDKQEAFRLGAQIAEMNKHTSHWEATSAFMMENGQFREATHDEHVRIASTELGKKGPQANMRDGNRLAAGHHIIDSNTGEKRWEMSDIGVMQLQSFDNGRMIGRLAENMTESQAICPNSG